MEISRLDKQRDSRSQIKKKNGSSVSKSSSLSFESELQRVTSQSGGVTIDQMLEELLDREKQFLDSQSLYELAKYKKAVQDLLKKLVTQAMEQRDLKRSRYNKNAIQSVVAIIDEKLLAMTEAVTHHSKGFNLMRSMEEIRGLILDMVL
jgi:uncharacterized protein YaaR (DUF327 family)